MNIFEYNIEFKNIKTIGIGLTNLCNLNCPHCYSRKMKKDSLNLDQIKEIFYKFPNLENVNYGTGESFLNKNFKEIVEYAHSLNIKQALTTNGTSIEYMDTELLKLFDDIDISIDFPDGEMHDKWRGNKGIFNKAIEGIKKCKSLGLNVSIVSVLMKNNCSYLKNFKEILDLYDVNLRINLYKSVNTDEYTPSYDEFWNTISDFNHHFKIISCSEPILALVCDEVKSGSLCGTSIRIHPDGEVSSCVYIKDGASNKEFNIEKNISPVYCNDCRVKDKCMGGCFGRRVSNQRKSIPDMYCPFYNNKPVPTIKLTVQQDAKELIHSSYLCTLILR